MEQPKSKNDIGKLNFEQTITELTGIVRKIEQGEIALEESLKQYERGMSLINHCREILSTAEKRIEKIQAEQKGEKKDDVVEEPEDGLF